MRQVVKEEDYTGIFQFILPLRYLRLCHHLRDKVEWGLNVTVQCRESGTIPTELDGLVPLSTWNTNTQLSKSIFFSYALVRLWVESFAQVPISRLSSFPLSKKTKCLRIQQGGSRCRRAVQVSRAGGNNNN
ncbi:hypothetical protein MHYP_G00187140 [Metynnis hypsauchen]